MYCIRFLVACALLVLFAGTPASAQGDLSVVYVPNRANAFIPVELVSPRAQVSDKAKGAFGEVTQKIRTQFHPMTVADTRDYQGKCLVEVRQPEIREYTFNVQCWSNALSESIKPLERLGSFGSPDQVFAFVRRFSARHFERLRQSTIERSRTGPTLIT